MEFSREDSSEFLCVFIVAVVCIIYIYFGGDYLMFAVFASGERKNSLGHVHRSTYNDIGN